jgi:hypothetical protein
VTCPSRYTLSIDSNRLHDYRVRNPHDEDKGDDVDPGDVTGRAGAQWHSTATAGYLVPLEDRGNDPGGQGPAGD